MRKKFGEISGVDKVSFFKKNYPALLMVLFTLIIWELFVKITDQPIWILPAPTDITVALINERAVILDNALITIFEATIGFIFALLISVFLAIVIDSYSFFKRGFYPILVISQTVPIIALAPLILAWFGYDILPKIVIVVLVAFFPIVINLVDGLESTDQGLISLMKTMNASKWQILFKIKFPSALPSLFSGLRIAATYSVMGAVIGEWMGAKEGLGIYMKNTLHSFQMTQLFAAIVVVVITSIMFYTGLLFLEKILVPWNKGKM